MHYGIGTNTLGRPLMHIIIRLAPERPIETPFEFVSYIPSSSKRTPEPVYNDQLYHRQLLLNEVEVDKTGNDKKMNPIQVPIRDSISRKSSKLGPIFRGPYKAVNVQFPENISILVSGKLRRV